MELVRGGELFTNLMKIKNYSEKNAALLTHSLLLGLKHLKDISVIHRDLKLENIILVSD